jgi:hypothetical protein
MFWESSGGLGGMLPSGGPRAQLLRANLRARETKRLRCCTAAAASLRITPKSPRKMSVTIQMPTPPRTARRTKLRTHLREEPSLASGTGGGDALV